ncbi:hypothetical protein C8Q76DRAFT_737726 [Earliella scabrosa]|nr:hypothetical protein C8Q76DRAFT_737726 [Earliella scabrosa]
MVGISHHHGNGIQQPNMHGSMHGRKQPNDPRKSNKHRSEPSWPPHESNPCYGR